MGRWRNKEDYWSQEEAQKFENQVTWLYDFVRHQTGNSAIFDDDNQHEEKADYDWDDATAGTDEGCEVESDAPNLIIAVPGET